MPGEFRALPGAHAPAHLRAKRIHLFMQLVELVDRRLVIAGKRLQTLDLAFHRFKVMLCLGGFIHGGSSRTGCFRLINDADTVAAAKFFHSRDESAVSLHIIALRLQHDQKVARAFQIEQHLGRTFALDAE